jgi:hypothetical protein
MIGMERGRFLREMNQKITARFWGELALPVVSGMMISKVFGSNK